MVKYIVIFLSIVVIVEAQTRVGRVPNAATSGALNTPASGVLNPIPDILINGGAGTVADRLNICQGSTPALIQIPQSSSADTTFPLQTPQNCLFSDYRNVGSWNQYGVWTTGEPAMVGNYAFLPNASQNQDQIIWNYGAQWFTGGINHNNGPKSFWVTLQANQVNGSRGQSATMTCGSLRGGFGDQVCLDLYSEQYGGHSEQGGDGQIGIDLYNLQGDLTDAVATNEFPVTISSVVGNVLTYTGFTSNMEATRGEDRFVLNNSRNITTATVTGISGTPAVVTGSGFAAAVCGGAAPCTPLNKFFSLPTQSYSDLSVDASNPIKLTSATAAFTSGVSGLGPTFIFITGGVGWTPGFYEITSSGAGFITVNTPPAALGTTGGTFKVGGNVFSTLDYVIQIASVASDSSMTLVITEGGVNTFWHGDYSQGPATIYTGSVVTTLNQTGSFVVADGTQFQPGDTILMPLGNNVLLIGINNILYPSLPNFIAHPFVNRNLGNRPATSLINNQGPSISGMTFSTNPYSVGIGFVTGPSPATGYLVTFDNVPNSIARILTASRNSGLSFWEYDKTRDAWTSSTNIQSMGGLFFRHIYVTNASSPYTVLQNDHTISCDASSGNVIIDMPSLQVPGTGGDNQYLIIDKADASTNTCTLTLTAGDHFLGLGSNIVLTARGQSVSAEGSNQTSASWVPIAAFPGVGVQYPGSGTFASGTNQAFPTGGITISSGLSGTYTENASTSGYSGTTDGTHARNSATRPYLEQIYDNAYNTVPASSTSPIQAVSYPFSASGVSSAVGSTSVLSSMSAAAQTWELEGAVIETTPGTGCTGNYTLTIQWIDERNGSVNSFTLAQFAWNASISNASGAGSGTAADGTKIIRPAIGQPPVFSIQIPSGCSGMQYSYTFVATRKG